MPSARTRTRIDARHRLLPAGEVDARPVVARDGGIVVGAGRSGGAGADAAHRAADRLEDVVHRLARVAPARCSRRWSRLAGSRSRRKARDRTGRFDRAPRAATGRADSRRLAPNMPSDSATAGASLAAAGLSRKSRALPNTVRERAALRQHCRLIVPSSPSFCLRGWAPRSARIAE